MIFEMLNDQRYVYYINSPKDFDKMEKFLNLIPVKISIIIISDMNTMNDPFGPLYCDPK